MVRQSSRHPTELELEILKILWRQGPSTVRQVRETMSNRGRDLAYTTVMTMLTIMTQKGHVTREKQGSGYIYTPRITENATSRSMLRDLVDRMFEGSTTAVVSHLIEAKDLDADQLKQLRELIDQRIQEGTK